MKICILIPVYNEAKTISVIVKNLKNRKLDVVVIDDGSTDGSGSLAFAAGAVVLKNDQKSGKGFSLKRGFDYIVAQGFDGVIIMDGDAQHDVSDLNQFIDLANQIPVCLITGNRMANAKGMPWLRYFTNHLMSGLISMACSQKIPDTQCGYRYISCEILKKVRFISGDFEIETEMLMKASKKGFKIYSVPIQTIYRDEVSHIHPFKDTFRFIRYFIKEIFTSSKS